MLSDLGKLEQTLFSLARETEDGFVLEVSLGDVRILRPQEGEVVWKTQKMS